MPRPTRRPAVLMPWSDRFNEPIQLPDGGFAKQPNTLSTFQRPTNSVRSGKPQSMS
jgi:hypothetical protein